MRRQLRRVARGFPGLGLVVAGLVVVQLMAGAARAAVPPSERTALIALYDALGGASWEHRDNWLGPGGTECTWYGVTCDGAGTTVQVLNLSGNSVDGTLPAAVSGLTHLVGLQVPGLSGVLPTTLGDLDDLQYIVLTGGGISGPLPASLANLGSLNHLRIFSQGDLGPLPDWIGARPNLRQVYFGGLRGPLPGDLGQWTHLEHLYLDGNDFGSPVPDLSALTGLTRLLLIRSNLQPGPMPAWLRELAGNLQELAIDGRTGELPSWLCELQELTYLNLLRNDFTPGPLPECFGSFPELRLLLLTGARRTGNLPAALADLPQFQASVPGGPIGFQLELDQNAFEGPLPASFAGLKGFVRLNGNKLQGRVPDEFAELSPNLFLSLAFNRLETANPDVKVLSPTTQTTPPRFGLEVTDATATSLTLRWRVVPYQGAGYYSIFMSTSPDGPYQLMDRVAPKSIETYTVDGLQPDTTYYFRMRSQTPPHAGNPNPLLSRAGPVFSGSTTP